MRLRLADIFAKAGTSLLASCRVPAVVKAVQAILACRTAVLGGHAAVCDAGHVSIWYNACRNRCCPRCSYYRIQQWLERTSRVLLGRLHHHVIFTVPHELNPIWLVNRRAMGDLLFQAVRDALFTLCGDPRHLGALPGAIMALHTWGQQLTFHPHVHCLITAGGITGEGEWRDSRRRFFLPLEPLKRLFRGRLLYGIRQALSRGELVLPPGWSRVRLERLTWQLHHVHWNVEVREPYADPTAVLNYLGRYLHGGPISESRLLAFTGDAVSFRYTNRRTGQRKVMRLATPEFLRRYLMHVPPQGFHMVRGYGLYRRGYRADALHRPARQLAPLSAEVRSMLVSSAHPQPLAVHVTCCATCEMPIAMLTKLTPLPMRARPAPIASAA